MARVYCLHCIWLFQRGGVWYCGNPISDLFNKSVTPDWEKSCDYFKGKY